MELSELLLSFYTQHIDQNVIVKAMQYLVSLPDRQAVNRTRSKPGDMLKHSLAAIVGAGIVSRGTGSTRHKAVQLNRQPTVVVG